jgi:hypothetical protein
VAAAEEAAPPIQVAVLFDVAALSLARSQWMKNRKRVVVV